MYERVDSVYPHHENWTAHEKGLDIQFPEYV